MIARFNTWPRWRRDIAPLLLWMALIFILSSRTRLLDIDNESADRLFYKMSHIIAYAVLAWLWWRALAPQRQTTWPALFVALSLTILYAISDEFHQSFVPGRSANLFDVLFDASGALAMILSIRYARRYRHKFQVLNTLMML